MKEMFGSKPAHSYVLTESIPSDETDLTMCQHSCMQQRQLANIT